MTITLRGWQAGAAALALLILVIAHQAFIGRKLDRQAIEGLKPHLKGRILSQALDNRPWNKLSDAEKKEFSDLAVSMTNPEIDLNNVSARGFGSRRVVRVEVSLQGKPPPDGRTVRYFSMEYSLLFGWIYRQEVGPLSYWLAPW